MSQVSICDKSINENWLDPTLEASFIFLRRDLLLSLNCVVGDPAYFNNEKFSIKDSKLKMESIVITFSSLK